MVLYVDGGCTGNGQKDLARRRMVAVVTAEDGAVLSEQTAEGGSNNIAELMAIRDALNWAMAHDQARVEIRTDSRNNFAWVFNKRLGKRLNDRAAVEQLRQEIATARTRVQLDLVWVSRDKNKAGHVIERKYGA